MTHPLSYSMGARAQPETRELGFYNGERLDYTFRFIRTPFVIMSHYPFYSLHSLILFEFLFLQGIAYRQRQP